VEAFKELNEKLKKCEEEKQQIMSRMKISEEKYGKLKADFDEVWKKLLDKEKKFNDIQLEVRFLKKSFFLIKKIY